jgi:hypothetical protein
MTPYDETVFWSRQFDEHLQFLRLLLTDVGLKHEANRLQKQYSHDRQRALRDAHNAPASLREINRTVYQFQKGVLERLRAGEFLGWAFPLFVDHITREMELFAYLTGDGALPAGQNVDVAVKRLGAEHAMFAAHLLDPSERALVRAASSTADRMMLLVNDPAANLEAADVELAIGQFVTDNGLGKGGALSIVPRALADHVIREQVYFSDKLRAGG